MPWSIRLRVWSEHWKYVRKLVCDLVGVKCEWRRDRPWVFHYKFLFSRSYLRSHHILPALAWKPRTSGSYTVKKVTDFPVPSRAITNQTLPGRLVTSRLGTGKIDNLFYSVYFLVPILTHSYNRNNRYLTVLLRFRVTLYSRILWMQILKKYCAWSSACTGVKLKFCLQFSSYCSNILNRWVWPDLSSSLCPHYLYLYW